jgi:hypothetical protein
MEYMGRYGAGDTTEEPGVYHVVCHDCQTEFLATDGSEAERQLSEHRSSTGHNVEFAALGGVDVEVEHE